MGVLFDVATRRRWALAPRVLLGRAATCSVVLERPAVSAEHAVLAWGDDGWELRDLGSTNGTWVAGRQLDLGQRVQVRAGDAFIAGAEPDLILEDDAGPGAVACAPTGEFHTAVDGLVELPHGGLPALLHLDLDGAWVLDVDGKPTAVDDGGEAVLAGGTWRFLVPSPTPNDQTPTRRRYRPSIPPPSGLTLCFEVSRDEESVGLHLRWYGGDLSLPSRAFHYLLLTLARLRAADQAAGVGRDEQGWVATEQLERMMGYGRERINVDIYRARTLLAECGVPSAATLIARRTARREVRIEAASFEITRRG